MLPSPHLVQGMGKEPVPPHWRALSAAEVQEVLCQYPLYRAGAPVTLLWHSPRPMSAAVLVEAGGVRVFVKRHHVAVRSAAQLAVEHDFGRYLRANGQPVPALLVTSSGTGVVARGEYVYEAHAPAEGVDLYRDALSWSPFVSCGHAYSAGRALGRFHLASAGFAGPERPFAVLTNSSALVRSRRPLEYLAQLCAERPGLRRALAGRPVRQDLRRCLLTFTERAYPLLGPLPPWWGHGDWHASNLTWSGAGPDAVVTGIIDLGLANRTYAVHDLALAIERNGIDWLDLAGRGEVAADWASVEALVAGYQDSRPLGPLEKAALVALLPVCHVEQALSEVEYFGDIVRSAPEADLAYDHYLLGHLSWFESAPGRDLLNKLAGHLGI